MEYIVPSLIHTGVALSVYALAKLGHDHINSYYRLQDFRKSVNKSREKASKRIGEIIKIITPLVELFYEKGDDLDNFLEEFMCEISSPGVYNSTRTQQFVDKILEKLNQNPNPDTISIERDVGKCMAKFIDGMESFNDNLSDAEKAVWEKLNNNFLNLLKSQ